MCWPEGNNIVEKEMVDLGCWTAEAGRQAERLVLWWLIFIQARYNHGSHINYFKMQQPGFSQSALRVGSFFFLVFSDHLRRQIPLLTTRTLGCKNAKQSSYIYAYSWPNTFQTDNVQSRFFNFLTTCTLCYLLNLNQFR